MPDNWIDLPLILDDRQLADDAVEALRAEWDGWEPNDGDPEVVLIESVAPMASDVAAAAVQMGQEAMIALGNLLGIPYQVGMSAEAHVTLHFVDDAGYTVRVPNDLIVIDGQTFELADDAVTVAPGDTTLSGVIAYATDTGVAGNDLPGDQVASLTLPAFVSDVTLDEPTFGGVDDEDINEYRDRMARDRRLASRTLVTRSDAVQVALDQPGIGRATAVLLGARRVSVGVIDPEGGLATDAAKAALLATYTDMLGDRLINTVYTVDDPTFSVVNVDWDADVATGYDLADAEAAVNAMLTSLLSPLDWGLPTGRSSLVWLNDLVVSKNDIIVAIGRLPQIGKVNSVTLSSPTAGTSVDADGNLTMAGTIGLPTPGAMTGTIH